MPNLSRLLLRANARRMPKERLSFLMGSLPLETSQDDSSKSESMNGIVVTLKPLPSQH
jgi:hypothetical protein